jgi:hypothetical protein
VAEGSPFSSAHGEGTPPQVPADAEASEVVDSTLAEPVPAAAVLGSALHGACPVQRDSEVPEVCAAPSCCYALRCNALPHDAFKKQLQVRSAASSSANDLTSHTTRPEHQRPSDASMDATESIAVDSNHHDESVASSIARARSRRGKLTISVAVAEPSSPSGLSDST